MDAEESWLFVNELVFAKTQIRLQKIHQDVFQKAWQGEKYSTIAEDLDYNEQYIKDIGSELWKLLTEVLGEPVKKPTVQTVLQMHYRSYNPSSSSSAIDLGISIHQDMGEAPDILDFHGREDELATLEQWILNEKCKLVVLLGMGGIGKTSLSLVLAQQLEQQFKHIIWRSLRESPSVNKILDDLLKGLSEQQETEFSSNINDKIRRLIQYLNESRCLIILDNAESIMENGVHFDQYLPGYESYGTLLERIGTLRHQSCFVLTSRVKPAPVAKLEGKPKQFRCLPLEGLAPTDAQAILKDNELEGSDDEAQSIAEIYSGNPLALNLVSTCIQEVFGGNMTDFLSEGAPIFHGVAEMLNEQFDQLADVEQSILYWLAINREPVLMEELLSDIIPSLSQITLQNALQHLIRRSLIQRVSKGFTLQNVIMEYTLNRFIEQVIHEIHTDQLILFGSHTLIKATAKDYIREAQIRSILEPIASRFTNAESLFLKLTQTIRTQSNLATGYAAGNLLNLLCHLKADLSQYDFSHLTIRQAYLQGAIAQGVNVAHSELSRTVFTQDFGIVFSVAYSPDGQYLATGHSNGIISLWQVATGRELLNCIGHTGRVYSVAFSPSGQLLASGSDDQSVRLWNVENGACLKTMIGHSGAVGTVTFSLSGQVLASGSEDKTIRLWDIPHGACLRILQEHTNHVWSVAFNETGELLASGSFDTSVKIWNIANGACLKTLLGHNGAIAAVAFSPDGQTLATGSHDKTMRLWSLDSGACLKIFQAHCDRVWSVAFSPSGEQLASGSYDKTVRIWDVQQGICTNTLSGHTSWIRSVVFHPSGQQLASGSYDTTIKVWNIGNGECLHTLQGYQVSICSLAVSPNGQRLVSGSDDQTVRLWNLPDGLPLTVLSGHSGWIFSVGFNPASNLLASGSSDKTVKLWSAYNGTCLNTLQGHDGWVYSVAFSSTGEILASGSADKTVRLWSVDSGACLNILQGHNSTVGTVAFSPSETILASGSQDHTLRLWDIRSGHCLKTLQGHTDQIWSIAFSPDGQTLASSSFDQTIRLWGVKSGKCLKILQGHTSFLLSVAFSPNGLMLVSGGYDASVRIWQVSSDECLSTLKGHQNWVRSVAFTPDGETVISGSQDETIKVWTVETGVCVKTIRALRPYERMNITGVTGLTEAEKATLRLLGAVEIPDDLSFGE
jgi:WD40 repeat protein